MTNDRVATEAPSVTVLKLAKLAGALNTLIAAIAIVKPALAMSMLAIILGNFLVASFFSALVWTARRLIGPPRSASLAGRETLWALRGIPSSGVAD
ncbi:MAG: hypothetical protein KDA37_05750 [Planctomycetales bacterium]|nr:hypothetical protein [Planctomycetales bacterium]